MKVTVKTLESGVKDFDLPDEAFVQSLKEQVAESMGIPVEKQRLIFQGKVIKDDKPLKEYGVDGKVIHLVQGAPPTSTGSTMRMTGEPSDSTVTLEATQDLVFLSPVPMPSQGDISQMTQNIVDQIVGALGAHGAQASVTAEATTTDLAGNTKITQVTAATPGHPDNQSPQLPLPPPQEESPPTSTAPKDESSTSTDAPIQETIKLEPATTIPSKQTEPIEKKEQVPPSKDKPSSQPTASGEGSSRSSRGAAAGRSGGLFSSLFGDESPEERERREEERAKRQLKSIHSQARTVRRCLDYAIKALDRLDKAEQRVAREAGGGVSVGPPVSTEPMEVVGGAEGMETMETTSGEDPFAVLSSGQLQPISSTLFMAFTEEIQQLQARVQPVIGRYHQLIRADRVYSEEEALSASRLSQTLKDYNYYIGHAYVALARLNVNMLADPPRTLRLNAPRRTEMRHIMSQLRSMPPQRPSGYIIDIKRDGEEGQEGQGQTTRATISREGGPFGGAGPFGAGGLFGGPRPGGPGGGPSLFGGLGGFSIPFSGGADEEEGKKETEQKQESSKQSSAASSSVQQPTEKKDEAMEIGEEVKEKPRPMETEVQASTLKPTASEGEGTKKEDDETTRKEGEDEEGEGDGETPQYLARLLSELITGMVKGPEEGDDDKKDGAGPGATGGGGASSGGGGGSSGGSGASGAAGGSTGGNEGTSSEPSSSSGGGSKAEGTTDGEEAKKDDKELSFAERYAGPEGTTVTIKAAPQGPFMFPGMEGPSVSIRNPGGGKSPEAVVNFPMPPALQLLQHLLRSAAEDVSDESGSGEEDGEGKATGERKEGVASSKETTGDDSKKGAEGGEPKPKKKKKKKRPKTPTPPPSPPKPFIDDDGEVGSISDAGSIDSIDTDHEGPGEFEDTISQLASVAIENGQQQSMHATMADLRSQFGAQDEEDEESEMGMVEQLLKAISHQLSVVDVMSVFQGNIEPIRDLQPTLLHFLQEKLLYGATPSAERKGQAVKNFLAECVRSIRAIEGQIPLRDAGIDFAQTIYNSLSSVLSEGYQYIIQEHSTTMGFARMMHFWGTRSSALFSNIIRHCVNRNEDFEEIIKLLIGTLFPPTTPSLILNMCSSSILKEMKRLKDTHRYTPDELDTHLVWRVGATPLPNCSYPASAFVIGRSLIHKSQPLPIIQQTSVPGGDPEEWVQVITQDREALDQASPQQPFSDAYISGMPAKRRKLDVGEPQTMTAQDLLSKTFRGALEATGAKITSDKSPEELITMIHNDPGLASSLGNEMYYITKDRLEKDPDFDPEKFPNAQKFYKLPKKSKAKQSAATCSA